MPKRPTFVGYRISCRYTCIVKIWALGEKRPHFVGPVLKRSLITISISWSGDWRFTVIEKMGHAAAGRVCMRSLLYAIDNSYVPVHTTPTRHVLEISAAHIPN